MGHTTNIGLQIEYHYSGITGMLCWKFCHLWWQWHCRKGKGSDLGKKGMLVWIMRAQKIRDTIWDRGSLINYRPLSRRQSRPLTVTGQVYHDEVGHVHVQKPVSIRSGMPEMWFSSIMRRIGPRCFKNISRLIAAALKVVVCWNRWTSTHESLNYLNIHIIH